MRRITLTETQVSALAGLLDAAVRAVGLRACKDAMELLALLETAESVEEDETKQEGSNGHV